MKHVKLIYWVIVFAGLFFSCYEDHSSLTYKLINPINIELGDESTEYTVFAYDTLEIKPIVYREGVEDAEDVDFLKHESVDLAQGFYFSRPIPTNRFEELYLIKSKIV